MASWHEMIVQPKWNRPSEFPKITAKEVHVWRGSYATHILNINYLNGILNEQEKLKANRFFKPSDRDKFIVYHGLLRCLLSRYTDRRPEDLVFKQNSFGKPYIDEEAWGKSIDFNMSDSGTMNLIAISCRLPVGVDLEALRPLSDGRRLAKDVFVKQELALIDSVGTQAFEEGFFFCWTRKEAVIKAIGKGLSLPLKNFSTLPVYRSLIPDDSQKTTTKTQDDGWKILSFLPAMGFYGALATKNSATEINFFELSGLNIVG